MLYYIAPEESREYILRNGILSPQQAQRLIASGEVPEEVLGVSYRKAASSYFPSFVSLISDRNMAARVAQMICFAKTGRYEDRDFRAIGYRIDSRIRDLPQFRDEERTRRMHSECLASEVLFEGKIGLEFIAERQFAVRTRIWA